MADLRVYTIGNINYRVNPNGHYALYEKALVYGASLVVLLMICC